MGSPLNGRRFLTLLATASVLVLSSASTVLAAGPPFPAPIADQAVYDTADALLPATRIHAEQIADGIEAQSGLQVVVYTQRLDATGAADADATAHAEALLAEWEVGGPEAAGMVILADVAPDGRVAEVGIVTGAGFEAFIDAEELVAIDTEMAEWWLDRGDLDTAIIVALAETIRQTLEPDDGPKPGPPYPDPIDGQAVYDFAGILSSEAEISAERTIDAIEERTAAELVVYTQLVDYGVTTSETESRARALIDQWGVGRAGFDDGMAIFFDIDPSLEHGQVQLYGAPGFEATYLSNSERQRIFEEDMVPFLRSADFDGALAAALAKVDRAATPGNAARIQAGRQIDAALGLIGAPVVFMGLAGWALFSWRRFGKDPVYLDDPSILMPAPPPDLTAASGAYVMEGGTSRRALTTAMLDLASRGHLSFREDRGFLGLSDKVGVDVDPPAGDEVEEARRARNGRRPIGPAEEYALRELRDLSKGATDGYIEADELPKFGESVPTFDSKLEAHAVKQGWMVDKPSKVVATWTGKGLVAIVAGVVALIVGLNIPISGLTLIGGAAIAGGVVVMIVAQSMPRVTMPGAMVRAMLAAYRRTLHKTMEQARSMQQVVDEAGLAWLETPDQAVVWGTALGLQGDIESVLSRSLEDVKDAPSGLSSTYFPAWYTTSDGSSIASGVASGSGGSIFSSSGIPNLGGMMSALGTIGNSPSSSGGGGGGGGFSGGSSGGGGGGAGGGF
jgi:uncharacterized membrane protein YgcG/fumarate reductase subunit D